MSTLKVNTTNGLNYEQTPDGNLYITVKDYGVWVYNPSTKQGLHIPWHRIYSIQEDRSEYP